MLSSQQVSGRRLMPNEFAKKYKLTCNIDDYFMEAHVKLRPVGLSQ